MGNNHIRRLSQIDILKGLAIMGVVLVHTLPSELVIKSQLAFSLGQQVPIFILLTGLVMYSSMRNNHMFMSNNELISTYVKYLKKRIYRILPGVIVSFVISAILWASLDYSLNIVDRYGFGYLTFIGYLPFEGPGVYYITLLIELVILFPLLFYFFNRKPIATLLVMFALNFAFEANIAKLSLFDNYYLYKVSILRYFAVLGLGMYIAIDFNIKSRRNLWILFLAPISAFYIFVANNFNYQFPLFTSGSWHNQNIFSVFYVAFLILIGLKYFPSKPENKILLLLEKFGKNSFHIFLSQILYFSVGLSRVDSVMMKILGLNNSFVVYTITFLTDFVLCYIGAVFLILIENKILNYFEKVQTIKVGLSNKFN